MPGLRRRHGQARRRPHRGARLYPRAQHAVIEDVDYRAPRGLDRALFQNLAVGPWIDAHDNLILCGPTGVGKSWLACALGHKACRDNRSVLYQRVPKLFADLALARGDGRYARILRSLAGVQLLILDDWGLEPLDSGARHDLYEILLEERYGRRSTILTSQIPVDKWDAVIGDPDLCRHDPRPPRSQPPSDRSRRREPQTPTPQIDPKGLTTSLQFCQKSNASMVPASQARSSRIAGRHHLGISGSTLSESADGAR